MFTPINHKNVQMVSAVWQGILSDCTRLVGTARGQAQGQGLIAAVGSGLVLSFGLNYGQISSVAAKTRNLVGHPFTSYDQLTALHALLNHADRVRRTGRARY